MTRDECREALLCGTRGSIGDYHRACVEAVEQYETEASAWMELNDFGWACQVVTLKRLIGSLDKRKRCPPTWRGCPVIEERVCMWCKQEVKPHPINKWVHRGSVAHCLDCKRVATPIRRVRVSELYENHGAGLKTGNDLRDLWLTIPREYAWWYEHSGKWHRRGSGPRTLTAEYMALPLDRLAIQLVPCECNAHGSPPFEDEYDCSDCHCTGWRLPKVEGKRGAVTMGVGTAFEKNKGPAWDEGVQDSGRYEDDGKPAEECGHTIRSGITCANCGEVALDGEWVEYELQWIGGGWRSGRCRMRRVK